jgi:GNAT superfamily N-acetyltransferase
MITGPRPVKPSEHESLLKLINSTLLGPGDTRGMEELYPGHLGRSNLPNLWVMVEDGRVVSHVGVSKCALSISGVRLPVVLMGSVCTAKQYRGLGLASRMLDHVRRRHDRQGFDLYMISGDRDLYRRLGAARAGRLLHYVLSRAALKPFGHPDVTVRPARAEDMKAIADLYRRERVHVIRSVDDFRRVFRTGWAGLTPARFYVAETEGNVTAYFVAGVTSKMGGPPRSGRLTVIEAAGSRTDLMAALHAACSNWNKRRIELSVSPTDRDTLALLSGRHLAEIPVPVYDCTAIINLARLIQRLRPLLAARAGPAGRRLTGVEREGKMELRLGSRTLILSPDAMVRLLFGEPQRDRPPGIRTEGAFGRVIRRAVPLPLVNPGINYV